MKVIIEGLDQDARDAGFSEQSLKSAVELRLRQSGIRVLDEGPVSVYVRLNVLDDKAGAYTFSIEVELLEFVYTERHIASILRDVEITTLNDFLVGARSRSPSDHVGKRKLDRICEPHKRPDVTDRLGRPSQTSTFPNANRDWKAAMLRAGFAPTRCYDIVHSYCTQLLLNGGGDVALVQKARGHRDIRTTLAYTQVTVDPRLTEAVEKAFTLRPKVTVRVAASRGDARK